LNRPLEQATTPSLEALHIYTQGKAELSQGQFLRAVPLFQRAIALDTNFAMAYYYAGMAFNNAGDITQSREYDKKAFALIDRVSAYERDTIAATYYNVNDERDKAIDAYRVAIHSYPGSWNFHNNLSDILISLGQFEEGLKEGQEAVRLQPHVEPPYRRLFDAYMCLNRVGEAKELAPQVRALRIDGARIHQRFLELAYLQDDPAAMAVETQWYAGRPTEYLSFALQAAYRNEMGQRHESSRLFQRAKETALRQGLRNVAADLEDADARAEGLTGNCRVARQQGRPALALALCGDAAQAEMLAAETSKALPNGTIWNTVQLPEIRAAIQLHADHPAKAVELLASVSPYERAYPEAIYLRGSSYLRLRQGAQAAQEFQKILDQGSQLGQHVESAKLGTVLRAGLPWSGARRCARGRCGKGSSSRRAVFEPVEECGSRQPHPSSGAVRIRSAAVRPRRRLETILQQSIVEPVPRQTEHDWQSACDDLLEGSLDESGFEDQESVN
jgi:tetratricopeptide (TPR) repeat protein